MASPESMDWAAQYASVNKLFEPPIKPNGYPADGFKPVTPAEKARILMELAESVDQPVVTVEAPTVNNKLIDLFGYVKVSLLSIAAVKAAGIDVPTSAWDLFYNRVTEVFEEMENPSA